MPTEADRMWQELKGRIGRMIDRRKRRSILIAASSSDLTLTTSNQDVAGCTLTLPHIGDYAIDAVFAFVFEAIPAGSGATAAIGVLTDSADTEVDTPRAALFSVPTLDDLDGSRATVAQQWAVTTTSKDTVYKLRARKDPNVANEVIKAIDDHTTIRAHYVGRAVG